MSEAVVIGIEVDGTTHPIRDDDAQAQLQGIAQNRSYNGNVYLSDPIPITGTTGVVSRTFEFGAIPQGTYIIDVYYDAGSSSSTDGIEMTELLDFSSITVPKKTQPYRPNWRLLYVVPDGSQPTNVTAKIRVYSYNVRADLYIQLKKIA